MREIRVLIADDDILVRGALRFFIDAATDIIVVGEASDGPSAVAVCHEVQPDVVLMDVRMPGGDGICAITELSQQLPHVKAIAITSCCSDDTALDALRAGAVGFLVKDANPEHIAAAVRTAHHGGHVLSGDIAQNLFRYLDGRRSDTSSADPTALPESERLSPREQDVIELLARGMSNSEIARELYLSEATVKSHLRRIMMRWDVRDRVQVLVRASKAGLVNIL